MLDYQTKPNTNTYTFWGKEKIVSYLTLLGQLESSPFLLIHDITIITSVLGMVESMKKTAHVKNALQSTI